MITETAEVGNIDAHRILVPLIEDQSNVRSPISVTTSFELDAKRVKSAIQRGLTNLVYIGFCLEIILREVVNSSTAVASGLQGDGWSYKSNNLCGYIQCLTLLSRNVKDGMEHDLAASEAEEKATRATRKDAATTVIDVLIEYIKSGKHGFRSFRLDGLEKRFNPSCRQQNLIALGKVVHSATMRGENKCISKKC